MPLHSRARAASVLHDRQIHSAEEAGVNDYLFDLSTILMLFEFKPYMDLNAYYCMDA